MKAIRLVLTLMIVGTVLTAWSPPATPAAGKINWMTFEEAQAALEKEPRKVMVDVYTKWCGPCKMMMSSTFTNANVVNYINSKYYAVKFDAEGETPVTFKGKEYKNPGYDPNKMGRNSTHELTRYIAPVNGRIAYPTLLYFDEKMDLLSPVQGYLKPQQIEPMLKYFGDNEYKDKAWTDYRASFVNEWN